MNTDKIEQPVSILMSLILAKQSRLLGKSFYVFVALQHGRAYCISGKGYQELKQDYTFISSILSEWGLFWYVKYKLVNYQLFH